MKKIFSFLLIIALLSCSIFAFPSSALSFDDLGVLQVEESDEINSVEPRAPGGGNGGGPGGNTGGGPGSGGTDGGDSGNDGGEATTGNTGGNNGGTGNGGGGPNKPNTDPTEPPTTPPVTETPPTACAHSNMQFVKTEQKATCSDTGVDLYKCSNCGYVEDRTTPKDTVNGHKIKGTTKNPTCTEPGEQSGTCELCKKTIDKQVLPALGHQFSQWSVKKQATATEKGIKERTCLECGFKETGEYTTGDELNPIEPSTDVIMPSEQESETYREDFLEFETETTVPSDSLLTRLNIKGSDIAVIIIVLLAIVMVIALLVYVLLLSRRKKEPKPKVEKTPKVKAPKGAKKKGEQPKPEQTEQVEAPKPDAEATEQAETSIPETEEVKN